MPSETLTVIVERAIKLVIFMPIMGLIAWWLFSAWLERTLSLEETVVGGCLWGIAFILGAISIVHGGWGFLGLLGLIYVALLALASREYLSNRKAERARLQGEVEKYLHAMDLDPANAAAYSFLGATYLKLRRFEEAEEMLRKALELEPESRMDRTLLVRARSHLSALPRRWTD